MCYFNGSIEKLSTRFYTLTLNLCTEFIFFLAQDCEIIYSGARGVCMHHSICQITYYDSKYYYAPSSCSGNKQLNCCPLITDKRVNQYSDPKKDPDGILITRRLVNNRPSDSQPVYYSYNLPFVHYFDGKLYK